MKEVNPANTSRAYAFEMWMNAPMPMVTFIKTLNVGPLLRFSRKQKLKFNMLMLWCIGKAATQVKEFHLLPVGNKLMYYDTIAVNTIVANRNNEVSSCDIPYSGCLRTFNNNYLNLTRQTASTCQNHDITHSMVIGTSALPECDIDSAVGMYSGIYNNPFIIWGRYRKRWFKTTLTISFQFHHTQMDGAHAARFLELLQHEIATIANTPAESPK